MGTGLKFLFEEEVIMNQGTILGSQIGRWIILAALVVVLGALLLTIRPVVAQTQGCADTGAGDDRKGVCSFSYAENDTSRVGRLTTREYDQTQVVKVWELVEDTAFPDHDDFRIDRKSGVLTFKVTPDYENPRSSTITGSLAEMNVYRVKAKLGDGHKFVYTEVTVRVTGVEEAETLTLSARQPEVGTQLTATLSGGDIRGLRTPDWQWQVDDGSGGWTDIEDAVNSGYTPKAGDVGKKLRANVSYQDSHDDDITKLGDSLLIGTGVTEFAVRAKPGSNAAPMFREMDEDTDNSVTLLLTSRRIEENSAPGMYVGPAVFATDNDHLAWDDANDPGGPRDVLTYSLDDVRDTAGAVVAGTAGHAAMFGIDQATGQIMTKAPLDHESILGNTPANAYQVVAKATDPSGASGMVLVYIHVLDVDEVPEVTGPAAITYFENATDLILDQDPDADTANDVQYTATDNDLDDGAPVAAGGSIQWQLTGPDASKFQFGTGDPDTYTDTPDANVTAAVTTAGSEAPASLMSPALQWKSAPDLEAAADVGGTRGDNVYEITVRAWDGDWEIGARDVTIRVANSDDVGKITLSHITPQQGTALTATLNDPDGVSQTVTWQWYAGADATATAIAGATSNTFTPPTTGDGATSRLTVTAAYTDNGGTTYGATAGDGDTDNRPTATSVNAARENTAAANQAPKFYSDAAITSDATATDDPPVLNPSERIPENETTTYTRYVLENQPMLNLTKTERDARVDADTTTPGHQVPATGIVQVYDSFQTQAQTEADPAEFTDDTANLHFSLSGNGAEYFEIFSANDPDTTETEVVGLIRSKGPLDFEARRSYTLTLTATDPAGLTDRVTVTIHVLDVPEIGGLESRIRVDENEKFITNLSADDPPDVTLGGLKWSLLTTTDTTAPAIPEAATTPPHNRNDDRSIDCNFDATNDGLCDNFRFSNFNSANTQLLFAIGTGETHNAPNFEMPSDRARATVGDQPAETTDNVYKIVVRVAFANLRSQQPGTDGNIPANHPNPQDDEKQDFEVWIRVDDVDEAPSFADDTSNRLTTENSDDALPSVLINRSVVGIATASDPEYGYMNGPQYQKKLVYSLDAGDYSNLFQIVPSTGEILTRSRLDYESLTELTEMGPSGGQHRIITGSTITATDDAMPMGNSDDIAVNIRVNDVNETPIPATPLTIEGMAAPSYMEGQETTVAVATYMVSGDNAAMATWSLSGTDMDLFELADGSNDRERMLQFKAMPDFEDPMGGADDDSNTYMVTIEVMHDDDGEVDMDSMAVEVMVTNAEEMGTVTLDSMYPSVGTAIMATLEDMDMVDASSVSWTWATDAAMDGAFTNEVHTETGSLTSSYTPVAADADMYLRATATYTDGFDSGNAEMAVSENPVANVAITGGMTAVSYPENSAGDVETYTAQSADTITWSVRGTDASAFTIGATSGVLSFNASPDYEAKSEYMVTVVATAGGAEDRWDVTVTITDQDDPASVTGLPANAMVGAELTATLVDEDMGAMATDWQWASSASMDSGYTAINGATSASYTVANADAGRYLMVTATYDDTHGTGKTVDSDAVMVTADVVQRYDLAGNNNGMIDIDELFSAIDDYFDSAGQDISLEELFEIINAFFDVNG